jgi:hypothetical protein
MKKIIILFIAIQGCLINLSYSQLVNGDFTQFNGCTVPTIGTCTSFSSTCVTNWGSAYGTPQILSETLPKGYTNYFGYMWSNTTNCHGEGMFAQYNFQANTTYQLSIDAQATDLSGSMNILLTNGLTHLVSDDGSCGDKHRSVSSSQNILPFGSQSNIPASWASYTYQFIANNADSQIYIFPCSNSSTQYNLSIDNLNVVFDCNGTIIYNNGIIPINKSKAGYISVGSTAGTGGSGTVTNSSNSSTYLIATNSITFVPGFQASVIAGTTFSAKIVDCNNILAARQIVNNSPIHSLEKNNLIFNNHDEQAKIADSIRYITDISKGSSRSNISIYPNPVKGRLNLVLNNFNSTKIKISIIDVSGKSYYSTDKFIDDKSYKSIEINTSILSQGTYFIVVYDGINSFIKQFTNSF